MADVFAGSLDGAAIVIDHVGILVSDFDASVEQFSEMLGMPFQLFEDDEALDCRWARSVFAGGVSLELVAARSNRSVYHTDLQRRGPGLHHISFRVGDLDETRRRIEAMGMPALGLDLDHSGWQEFFVHPRNTDGALVHFCVPPVVLPAVGAVQRRPSQLLGLNDSTKPE